MTLEQKRKTYLDRIERLHASYSQSQDGAHRAYCLEEIEREQRLLKRLEES